MAHEYDVDEGRVQPVVVLAEDPNTGKLIPVSNILETQATVVNIDEQFLDADGGLKVHVQNPSGGEGGGGGIDPVSIKDGSDPTRKLAVDASGRVGVNNFPASQAVTGSVSVSNFPATQPVSGTVAVSNPTPAPETGLAKETTLESLRADIANGIPVSGSVSVSNMVAQGLTDAQLRATAVPVSGTFWQATQPVSGSVTADVTPASPAANDYLPVRLTDGSAFYVASGGGGGASTPPPTYTLETPIIAEALAAANKVLVALQNPVGSAKVVKIRAIWVTMAGAAIAASAYDFRAFRISATVGGTALVATKNDTANANSVVTTLVHSPTSVTAALTTALWSSRWAMVRTTSGTFGDLPSQVIRFGTEGQQPPTLRAGEGLAVEELTRTAGNDLIVGIEWTEE